MLMRIGERRARRARRASPRHRDAAERDRESRRGCLEVFGRSSRTTLRRPLFWVLLLSSLFFALRARRAATRSIGSGDARVGGTKAWITSEFAITQLLIVLVSLLYVFFISVGAGHVADPRRRAARSARCCTPRRSRPASTCGASSSACSSSFVVVLALHVALHDRVQPRVPHGENAEFIGPFALGNYLRPALVFALPTLVLFAGACFAIGGLTRKPVLVFVLPIARADRWASRSCGTGRRRGSRRRSTALLQFVDLPACAGSTRPTSRSTAASTSTTTRRRARRADARAARCVVRRARPRARCGCAGALSARVARRRRGARGEAAAARPRSPRRPAAAARRAARRSRALGMRSGAPGFVAGALEVARTELHELLGRHPGLYLFVPLILLQIFGGLIDTGAFDTPLLQHAGHARGAADEHAHAAGLHGDPVLHHRVAAARAQHAASAPIAYATPVRTAALLAGKALANALLGAAIVLAALVGLRDRARDPGQGAVRARAVRDRVGPAARADVLPVDRVRRRAYAVDEQPLRDLRDRARRDDRSPAGSQVRDKMNWVLNWDLWSAMRWSDISAVRARPRCRCC